MNPAALTVEQRRQQLALRAILLQRLIPLWQLLDPQRLDQTFPAWLTSVAPVVQDSRVVSSALAAAYVRLMREAAGIKGAAPIEVAGRAPLEQIAASLSATSLASIRKALAAGQGIERAMQTGFVASSGSAARLALQGGRDTVLDTVRADPKARGWQRWPSPDACDFCLMISDRGAVFSPATADFAAHDHCGCVAGPAYETSTKVRDYTPTVRHVTDADRTRVRAYLREHYRAA